MGVTCITKSINLLLKRQFFHIFVQLIICTMLSAAGEGVEVRKKSERERETWKGMEYSGLYES